MRPMNNCLKMIFVFLEQKTIGLPITGCAVAADRNHAYVKHIQFRQRTRQKD